MTILMSQSKENYQRHRGHHIMIKGSIHRKDTAKLNVDTPNNRAKICEAKTD